MDVQKKKTIYVIVVAVLVILGGLYLLKNKAPQDSAELENATTTEALLQTENAVTTTAVSNEPPSENPPDQGDVTNQPAYLIRAYDDHGANYIGVDYVLVFKGAEAIQAQIEDGLCSQESECTVYPEGYIRNNNPHYRSYEISTTTALRIEAGDLLQSAFASKGINTSAATFENLVEILPTMQTIASSTFPFKEAKAFVYIDILGGGVTKIREP
jgi:hypothetical protein